MPDSSTGPLLRSLRNELRRELDLEPLDEDPIHFRIQKAGQQGDAADATPPRR